MSIVKLYLLYLLVMAFNVQCHTLFMIHEKIYRNASLN